MFVFVRSVLVFEALKADLVVCHFDIQPNWPQVHALISFEVQALPRYTRLFVSWSWSLLFE